LAILALASALPAIAPAMAQDRGGLQLNHSLSELNAINTDNSRGCPLSATSVTVGVNKATAFGSTAQQQLGTFGRGSSGCRPLVNTQVVAGVNLGLGTNSTANQAISAQSPRGVLANTAFTRGFNAGVGANSTANQSLSNIIGH
jgi:hypothetical protein